MGQTNINIRMDEDLKKQFDALCTEMGLNMSTAFNVFARAVVRKHAIPFEISAVEDPFYGEVNMARLKKSITQLDAGKGTVHELIEVEDE